MRSERRPLLWLLLAVLALSLGAGGGVATGHTTQQELQPAATTFDVQLTPSGDADWTVSTQFRLATENETEAFERLAARFEAGEADLAYDAETFREAAARGAPGREMAIRAVEYDSNTTTRDGERVGRLSLQFEWTDFAQTTGESYRLGDAFNTTDGTWLPGLASDQALVIRPPDGYSVETAPVPVDNGVLRWDGRQSFTPGYLGQITYTGETSTPVPNGPSPAVLGGVGALIVLILAGGYLWWQRQPTAGGPGTTDSGSDDGTDGAAAGAVAGGSTASDDTNETTAGATAAGGDGDEPDPELLSDEERVLRLLEANDGRMKQGTIVEETGWSNAKVSQLLSAMDEAGEIEKLRIGRENLISLPGEGVGDIDDN
ncbi:hypothetical protein DM867_12545 [Halosegnis rubeus]|uniref:HTH iclR-type domain-containing protein n=1 Tax=Halosegnis rubeus TaxID=2212850 RepID=A0A5N5U201_9EURY|nr:hypothetical protein [Halosegnis rubeus]KAB7512564.1 hypothetical protein DM867_12545 [Halosegnis rubeus]KAB7514499.1 hypothetical protein DP108_12050 [Halosegnis rubeus]KAB7517811.1 hypothetical protein DMP03_00120 [Halosegnis rubeus]